MTTPTVVQGPDAELVILLRSGDDTAFASVLDAWSGGMQRLARSIVTTEASAAEVVQETWLAVIRSIDRFEGRSSLRTWVYRILINAAKRRAVQEQRAVPWSSLELGEEATVDPEAFRPAGEPWAGHWWAFPDEWPEEALLAAEVRTLVAEAVQRLPEQQRAVLTLRDIEGFTGPETASMLELSEVNQRVLLHRARARLRDELDHYVHRQARHDEGGAR
ncbi:MAG TPA: sigma-70 family RNA polymerase sigma factor [Nocardioides sp.]|nr:sigma-70 family RNA polymerase sigma factor [Nocardioides sp.]